MGGQVGHQVRKCDFATKKKKKRKKRENDESGVLTLE